MAGLESRACVACHMGKIGCDKKRPTCSRCEKRGQECVPYFRGRGRPATRKPAFDVDDIQEAPGKRQCTSTGAIASLVHGEQEGEPGAVGSLLAMAGTPVLLGRALDVSCSGSALGLSLARTTVPGGPPMAVVRDLYEDAVPGVRAGDLLLRVNDELLVPCDCECSTACASMCGAFLARIAMATGPRQLFLFRPGDGEETLALRLELEEMRANLKADPPPKAKARTKAKGGLVLLAYNGDEQAFRITPGLTVGALVSEAARHWRLRPEVAQRLQVRDRDDAVWSWGADLYTWHEGGQINLQMLETTGG